MHSVLLCTKHSHISTCNNRKQHTDPTRKFLTYVQSHNDKLYTYPVPVQDSSAVPCGPGVKKITRSCSNPSPSAGGAPCNGDAVTFVACIASNCQGEHYFRHDYVDAMPIATYS